MSAPATLADLRKMMQASVRKIGRDFTRPGDDWEMVFIVQTPSGIDVVPLRNEFFESGLSKDVLGETMREWVVLRGAFRYAVLFNTHSRWEPSEEDIERVRNEELHVRDLPGAIETLVLTVGDAESEELWTCEIRRDGKLPPTLGPWTNWTAEGASWLGRFAGLNAYMQQPRRTP